MISFALLSCNVFQVRDTENLRARVHILESVLRRKDKQISELSGITFEKNDDELTDTVASKDAYEESWHDTGEDAVES